MQAHPNQPRPNLQFQLCNGINPYTGCFRMLVCSIRLIQVKSRSAPLLKVAQVPSGTKTCLCGPISAMSSASATLNRLPRKVRHLNIPCHPPHLRLSHLHLLRPHLLRHHLLRLRPPHLHLPHLRHTLLAISSLPLLQPPYLSIPPQCS